ncbi:MAG TPA: hypothetical protein VMG59_10785 [Phycisphaerae bacterium]|nr:hypothetical protein [Phycisphaerae bacterium]
MSQREQYRRSTQELFSAPKRPAWILIPAGIVLTFLLMALIAGSELPQVLLTLTNAVWAIAILAPAFMLGLAATRPLRNSALIASSPWPDGWRLVLSAAIGLGLLGLLTLLLGSLHLLIGWFPAALLLVSAAAGYPATRELAIGWNRQIWQRELSRRHALVLLACAPLACMLVAGTLPAGALWHTEGYGYDVQEYHLQLPKQFLDNNSTMPVEGNIYSYFPLNMEMLYVLIGALVRLCGMSGTTFIYSLVFGAQILHVLITLLAAVAVALAPLRIRIPARILAFLVVISTPWTIVIGSLAYNDGAVLLFTIVALAVALRCRTRGDALLLGILLGLAVGCKMTAGVMIALPVAALLLARRRWTNLAVVATLAMVVYSPWALRSMVATHTPTSIGNPIFPLFAHTLGMDDWNDELAARFDRGHTAPANQQSPMARIGALADQSLLDRQFSPGVAALSDVQDSDYPSQTPWPMRFGIIWLAVLPALALAMLRFSRNDSGLLFLVFGVQVLAWLTCTQLQARFLLPAIAPLAWLLAIGTDAVEPLRLWTRSLLAIQAVFCLFLLRPEAGLFLGPVDQAAPGRLIGQVFVFPEDWVINHPPLVSIFSPSDTFYLEGTSKALYFPGHVIYNTVFDENKLADILDKSAPAAAVAWLQKQGVNYLVVDFNEVDRLRKTYGFPASITPMAIMAMEKYGLTPLEYQTAPEIWILRVPAQ